MAKYILTKDDVVNAVGTRGWCKPETVTFLDAYYAHDADYLGERFGSLGILWGAVSYYDGYRNLNIQRFVAPVRNVFGQEVIYFESPYSTDFGKAWRDECENSR